MIRIYVRVPVTHIYIRACQYYALVYEYVSRKDIVMQCSYVLVNRITWYEYVLHIKRKDLANRGDLKERAATISYHAYHYDVRRIRTQGLMYTCPMQQVPPE